MSSRPCIPTKDPLVSCMQNREMFIYLADAGSPRLPPIRACVEPAKGPKGLRRGRRRASNVTLDQDGQREAAARHEEEPGVVLHAFELPRLVGVAGAGRGRNRHPRDEPLA